MRIDGPIPMHIARAYGLPNIAKPTSTLQPSVVGTIAPKPAVQVSITSKLVAAQINQPIDFKHEAMAAAPAQPGVFQMYTRAADRIEAAVNVELGRQIDIHV